MASAVGVNPSTPAGITIGSSIGAVGDWLRSVTVCIRGSSGSQGSGVVWMPGGLIVTNAHVSRESVQEIEFADGRTARARLVARDPRIDLAALDVAIGQIPSACVRSARTLRTGELVIAVGNPWDGCGAVSIGVVHRPPGEQPWVAADIRLAPGNSGGPLADACGNVVGINSMIVNGLGRAVTSDAVSEFLRRARMLEVA